MKTIWARLAPIRMAVALAGQGIATGKPMGPQKPNVAAAELPVTWHYRRRERRRQGQASPPWLSMRTSISPISKPVTSMSKSRSSSDSN